MQEIIDDINFVLNKEKNTVIKPQLLLDFKTFTENKSNNKVIKQSLENLINYFSQLDNWEEEIITFLSNELLKNK